MNLARSRENTVRLFLSLIVVTFQISLTGCKDSVENLATDDDLLRLPTDQPTMLNQASLFPLTKGSRWKLQARKENEKGEEEVLVTSSRLVDGFTETVVETRSNGRAIRQEFYRWNDAVTQMTSAGFADKVTLEPPFPLFRNPAKVGDTLSWSGVLRFKGSNAPGTGASRISGIDKIRKFDVYRVDTVIRTTVNGGNAVFRIIRWLSPGVGLVRQRTVAGESVIEKDLVEYTPGK
jgi:hypothetical protein